MLLYLHIPFCHRVCPYCAFYKHTPGSTRIGDFVAAVVAEARVRLAESPAPPRTLYLGGGTPSMLSPGMLRRLFDGLAGCIDFPRLEEVTMEANPATFGAAKARLFRECGVTRISLGVQSFDGGVLHSLGREHDAEQARQAVGFLRGAEMPEVNIDLMFSVPGQNLGSWRSTLEQALALEPEHVSAYNLTYEEDTAFFESLKSGALRADEDRDAEMFHLARRMLGAAGYEHYETSNYARPGHESIHNRGYWDGEDYLGLGPSAVSTLGGTRETNVADTAAYVAMIGAVGRAVVRAEKLDPEARRIERIAMGLRTSAGVPCAWLENAALERAGTLAEAGLVRMADGRLTVTPQGAALVDPIAAELI